MKRLILFLLILFGSVSTNPQVGAAEGVPQGKVGTFTAITRIPKKVCLGDTMPVIMSVLGNAESPTEFVIVSDNSFSPNRWPLPAGAQPRPPIVSSFTATKIGEGFANFGFVDGPAGKDVLFKVVECDYSVRIFATSTTKTELVTFKVETSGSGNFSSSNPIAGNGNYSITIKADLAEIADNPCRITGEAKSEGNRNFSVSGSNDKGNLLIDIVFDETLFVSSPQLVCKDPNNRRAAEALFPKDKVNPNQYLKLTGLRFTPGLTQRRLPFGSNGWCAITIAKREKK